MNGLSTGAANAPPSPSISPAAGEPGQVEHGVALDRPGAGRGARRREDAEGVVSGPHAAG